MEFALYEKIYTFQLGTTLFSFWVGGAFIFSSDRIKKFIFTFAENLLFCK